jgi:trehalose-6-phosphatase
MASAVLLGHRIFLLIFKGTASWIFQNNILPPLDSKFWECEKELASTENGAQYSA